MGEQDYKKVIKVLLVFLTVLLIAIGYFCVELAKAYEVIEVQKIEIELQKKEIEKITTEREEVTSLWEKNYNELKSQYETLMAENKELTLKSKKSEYSKSEFTEDEIYMLAQCVEAEAGIGNEKSQRYVTQVILNRLHSDRYPNTLKKVIYQKTAGNIPQFSVAYDGSMEGIVVKEETLENVRDVLKNGTDLPKYVFFFYSDTVTNNWVNTLNTYKVVDGTVFAYSSKEC